MHLKDRPREVKLHVRPRDEDHGIGETLAGDPLRFRQRGSTTPAKDTWESILFR